MQRRTFVAASTAAVAALAGCAEEISDDILVSELVTENRGGPWPFEAEADTELVVECELDEGFQIGWELTGPDDDLQDPVGDGKTENEGSWTVTTEQTGTHRVIAATGGRGHITVKKA
jgi:hypothetical protein